MLKEKIALEEVVPKVGSVWRASEVGECETFLGHVRLSHESLPFSGRVRHMLDDGIVHEHDIVDRLRRAGITVLHSYADGQAEVCCSLDPLIIGHPDGILDVPKGFPRDLDYCDKNFKFDERFYLLEVTAPNHFVFLRLKHSHLREVLLRKFIQAQMYLNSGEIGTYGDCCVVEVKNKNTSELYEEGVSLDRVVVDETLLKLRRIEDLASQGKVSDYRCDDWRRKTCRYRHLCFEEEEAASPIGPDVLKGESLKEAEHLKEIAAMWRRGRLMRDEGSDLIADSREEFRSIIEEYGCKGLTIEDVKALMVEEGIIKQTDFTLLEKKYPDAYAEVVKLTSRESYVRVTD